MLRVCLLKERKPDLTMSATNCGAGTPSISHKPTIGPASAAWSAAPLPSSSSGEAAPSWGTQQVAQHVVGGCAEALQFLYSNISATLTR